MNDLTKKAINFINYWVSYSMPILGEHFNQHFPLTPKENYDEVDLLISHIDGNVPTVSTISLICYLVEKITGERIAFAIQDGYITGAKLFTGELFNSGMNDNNLKLITEQFKKDKIIQEIKDYTKSLNTPQNEIYKNNEILILSCFSKAMEIIENNCN